MYIAHCNLSLKLGVFAADNTTDLHRIYTRIYTLLCKYTIYIGLIRDTTIIQQVYNCRERVCCIIYLRAFYLLSRGSDDRGYGIVRYC